MINKNMFSFPISCGLLFGERLRVTVSCVYNTVEREIQKVDLVIGMVGVCSALYVISMFPLFIQRTPSFNSTGLWSQRLI